MSNADDENDDENVDVMYADDENFLMDTGCVLHYLRKSCPNFSFQVRGTPKLTLFTLYFTGRSYNSWVEYRKMTKNKPAYFKNSMGMKFENEQKFAEWLNSIDKK